MIKEQNIIQFEYRFGLYNRLDINNDIHIDDYKSSININVGFFIRIYYNNLRIYSPIPFNNYYDCVFNLSNILYKLHTKEYYCRFCHKCKELI